MKAKINSMDDDHEHIDEAQQRLVEEKRRCSRDKLSYFQDEFYTLCMENGSRVLKVTPTIIRDRNMTASPFSWYQTVLYVDYSGRNNWCNSLASTKGPPFVWNLQEAKFSLQLVRHFDFSQCKLCGLHH